MENRLLSTLRTLPTQYKRFMKIYPVILGIVAGLCLYFYYKNLPMPQSSLFQRQQHPSQIALLPSQPSQSNPSNLATEGTPTPTVSQTPSLTPTPNSTPTIIPSTQKTQTANTSSQQNTSSSSSSTKTSPTPTPAPTPTPTPTPTPVQAMSTVSVNTPSVSPMATTSSGFDAGWCSGNVTTQFSTNGSGTVQIMYYVKSRITYTAYEGETTYTFSSSGTKTDTYNLQLPGLQSGDAYTLQAIVTDTSNEAISETSAAATISQCGYVPAFASYAAGTMTSITPQTPSLAYNTKDSVFQNMCSDEYTISFSVNGTGTVGVLWKLTSSNSGGYTFDYAEGNVDYYTMSGAGDSDTDQYYVRTAYTNPGDHYTLTATLFNSANNITTVSSPITFSCP